MQKKIKISRVFATFTDGSLVPLFHERQRTTLNNEHSTGTLYKRTEYSGRLAED